MSAPVILKNGVIYIDGKPTILLCSSLFYFRIPRECWRERMRQLKKSGYNAIDVYFPWNEHEVTPGVWDFAGQRDVAAFLDLAAQEQLYVVARPGPYICSEWDGGGIPIWVHMASEHVRQYDAEYIALSRQWFDRILPIIRDHQLGHGGSIVLLQLENELDLFPCLHAHRYMESIRDMADEFGMEVPYVACVAGRGDIDAASGHVERITPSFNIYPPFSDPSVEERMEIIQKEIMMPRGWPLLATETEREHNFMRRELASGVRLISPYCQTATTNFDCRMGVSAWSSTPEKRVVYITNDYDMGSMLKTDGAVTREFLEARLLANLFNTLGEKVAAGAPFADHPFRVETDFQTNYEGVHAMALQGGGWMLCLPNLSREEGAATVAFGDTALHLTVEGDTTRLLLFDLPLDSWGYAGAKLLWSTMDIAWFHEGELVMYGNGEGVCIQDGEGICHRPGNGESIVLAGRTLTLRILGREEAARAASPYLPAFDQPVLPPWRSAPAEVIDAETARPLAATTPGAIEAMEKKQVYGGRMVYEFDVPECKGLLLFNTTDIATLRVDGKHVRTWISDGSTKRLPVTGGHVSLQTEIWGHTCFTEFYNPLMHMESLRGLEGVLAIQEERNIHNVWRFTPDSGDFTEYVTPVWSALPCITDYGTLIPRGVMLSGMFRREIVMPEKGNTRLLSLLGLTTMHVAVYVNGKLVREVDRTDPYVDITDVTAPGKAAELILRVRADSTESLPGNLRLIAADRIDEGCFGSCSVAEMASARTIAGDVPAFPLQLKGGEGMWLRLNVKPDDAHELWLRPEGHEVMVTICQNGHVLGRLMPDSDVECLFRSGDSDRVWMPRPWLEKDGEVRVLVEGLKDGATLDALYIDQRG